MKNLLKFVANKRIASAIAGVAMVGMLVGGNVGTALADSPVNLPVSGPANPSVSVTNPSFYSDSGDTQSISGITLNGSDQSVYIKMPLQVTDATGTGNGWSVTFGASTFTGVDTTSHHLAAPTITAVDAPTVGTDSSNLPNNVVQVSGSPSVGSQSSPTTLLSVPSGGDGMGQYNTVVRMALQIKASDYADAGGYGSTFYVDTAAPLS